MSRKMPAATQMYAEKFAANWKAQNPDEEDDSSSLDDSLTNLQWLHSINIQDIAPGGSPSTPPSPSQSSYSSDSEGRSVSSDLSSKAEPSNESKIDYKNDANRKPPYSYATLICMAMRETNKSKITLSAIYKWIKENFMYYRHADPTWQNSIRHNLSLNKCFSKVPRRKDEPGKGGFWRIDPAYADMFVDGVFKRRRGVNTQKVSKKSLAKAKVKNGKKTDEVGNKRAVATQPWEGPRSKKCRPNGIKIKTEPPSMYNDDDFLDEEIPPFSGGLKGDFSWMSVLTNYELDESIKEIADAHGISLGGNPNAESPMGFNIPSPPPLISDDPDETFEIDPDLDLTIQGIGIFQHRQHLSTPSISPATVTSESQALFNIPPSPNAMYIDEHPWAETGCDDELPCFDIDENNNST